MAPAIIILICGLLILTPVFAATSYNPSLMLAKTTELLSIPDKITNYIVSEKLDGMRAFWNGSQLLTKQGNVIHAPAWFITDFPKTKLDGELWIERNSFEQLISTVRKHMPVDEEWKHVKYMIFDAPDNQLPFQGRLKVLETIISKTNHPWLQLIPHQSFENIEQLETYYQTLIKQGAEGVMLHHIEGLYLTGRQTSILKLKPYFDDEAIVVGHVEGKGKFQGMLGSLIVKNHEGVVFKIGSGFTHKERLHPPAINEIITYKFQGLTRSGKPRFATFLRVRKDIDVN